MKAQVTGPITLATCIEVNGGGPLARDTAALRILTAYVGRQAGWQIRHLRESGARAPVLMVVDEPCLALASARTRDADAAHAALAEVYDAVRAWGARAGAHCCAEIAPAALCAAEPDVVSFDAHRALETFAADAAVRGLVRRGGWLALGLVPTAEGLDVDSNATLFARWLMAVCDADESVEWARATLVTASCGLGGVSQGAAEASFRIARDLGERIRWVAERASVAP